MTKKAIKTDKSPAAIGPYSQGINIENLIFTSGQIPFDKRGELVSENIKEQTERVLENIKNILNEEGLKMDDIIKCTIFLDDIDDFDEVNEVYKTFFQEPYPARSCVEVARLPRNVKLEIEAIALNKS